MVNLLVFTLDNFNFQKKILLYLKSSRGLNGMQNHSFYKKTFGGHFGSAILNYD